jgi:hydrogenase-4 component B
MPIQLVLFGAVLLALSGLPALFSRRRSSWGQVVSTVIVLAGSSTGIVGIALHFFSRYLSAPLFFPWPAVGNSVVGLDSLSAFFLFPVFVMSGAGSLYGTAYWPQKEKGGSARRLQMFWGLMAAGMVVLLLGKHAMAFLLGWEVMALSGFFLITADDTREETRKAGLIYFIATHISTLILFALFTVWRLATGSFSFLPVSPGSISLGLINALFLLAFIGFGIKAGLMPLHFWLPGAHANAPSHVSAMLSGVMLKMGVFGFLRVLTLMPVMPAMWGWMTLAFGAVSGLLGVIFAIGQHDLKRLLAYHSVENIGIIYMGIGLAMLGRAFGHPEWTALGLAGALLHVWNHGFFKSLLFFGAGSVQHASGTRQIDRLGGLGRAMPWTAAFFLIGSIAICGLPPLNGFISELLIYAGFFHSLTAGTSGGTAAAFTAPVLAMIGALATACFVKVCGTVFLGLPRGESAARAHESPARMLLPMGFLVLLCLVIGVAPYSVVPILEQTVAAWAFPSGLPSPAGFLPLRTFGWISLAVAVVSVFITGLAVFLGRKSPRRGTWDCGYAKPEASMQYTASSFGSSILYLFHHLVPSRLQKSDLSQVFPAPAAMRSHIDDPVLDQWIRGFFRRLRSLSTWFRRFQQGMMQYYILYIVVALFVLLCTLIPFRELLESLFHHS